MLSYKDLTGCCYIIKNKFIIIAFDSIQTSSRTVLDSEKLNTWLISGQNGVALAALSAPVIEELAKEYDGKVNVGKVNVDHNPNLSVNYGITSIPAILFIKGGQIVEQATDWRRTKICISTKKSRRIFSP